MPHWKWYQPHPHTATTFLLCTCWKLIQLKARKSEPVISFPALDCCVWSGVMECGTQVAVLSLWPIASYKAFPISDPVYHGCFFKHFYHEANEMMHIFQIEFKIYLPVAWFWSHFKLFFIEWKQVSYERIFVGWIHQWVNLVKHHMGVWWSEFRM